MFARRHAPPDYDCPFCAFARGEERPPWNLRADVVWQDEETLAWMNPRWWDRNPGNVLVIPNRHVESIFELDGRLAGVVHETARRIATAGADQEVWHYHVHVFPRHRGDGLYGASARLTEPDERHPYAERLRAAL